MKKKKIKDIVCFVAAIVLFAGSFLPCFSALEYFNEAVIDQQYGLIIPIAAIIAAIASIRGWGLIQIPAGAAPIIYLLVYRIVYRKVFVLIEIRYGLWVIVLSSIIIILSGVLNLPKKKY